MKNLFLKTLSLIAISLMTIVMMIAFFLFSILMVIADSLSFGFACITIAIEAVWDLITWLFKKIFKRQRELNKAAGIQYSSFFAMFVIVLLLKAAHMYM